MTAQPSNVGFPSVDDVSVTSVPRLHGFVGAATELRLAIALRAMIAPGLNVAVGRSADGRAVTNRAERNIISAVRAQDAAPVFSARLTARGGMAMATSQAVDCTCRHSVDCNHECHGRHCDPREQVCSIEFLPDDGGLTRWGCPDCSPGLGMPHLAGCQANLRSKPTDHTTVRLI